MHKIHPKIIKIPGTEIPGNNFSKIWVYLARLFSFLKIPAGNAILFATGNFWKFKPELLIEWRGPPFRCT